MGTTEQPGTQGAAAAPSRPGGLTALCIMAGVTALFALIASTSSLSKAMGAVNPMEEMAAKMTIPEIAELQRVIFEAVRAVDLRWRYWLATYATVSLITAVPLGVGALLAFRLHPRGRATLLGAMLFALLVEVSGAVPNMMVQREAMATLSSRIEQLAAAPSAAPAVRMALEASATMMTASVAMGYVLAVVFLLGKLGFYAYGLVYLRRPAIVALFRPPS